MRRSVAALLSLFVLASGVPARATTAIVVKYGDLVFIGADSQAEDLQTGASGSVCRIVPIKDGYFVAAGLTIARPYSYNARTTAIELRKATPNLNDFLAKFTATVTETLNGILSGEKNNPVLLKWLLKNQGGILQTIFVFNGSAVVSVVSINFLASMPISLEQSNPISVSPTKPNWCSEGCNQISYMGIYDDIKGFGADYFVKYGFDSAIQQLIEVQAKATPSKVGLPTDVVRIDPTGSQWLHRKPFCADEN